MSSRTWCRALLGAGLLWGCDVQVGLSQITRIDMRVVESPAYEGARFGEIGQYERLRGVFYGEADPRDRRNAEVVDIDRAPRNALGRVEYATIVEIVRPIDMAKWNRTIYHIVPNRGGVAGDTALLGMGFALVQVGWQGDIAASDRNIVAYLPIARNPDGSSIVGPALEEFIFDNAAQTVPGQWNATLSYPAASLDRSRASLTVRRAAGRSSTRITSFRVISSRSRTPR
jgi:hypothetical protein